MDNKIKNPITDVVKTDPDRLAQFSHNYKDDKKKGIQRYSNALLKTFESLDSHAMRMYKSVSDGLDLYPMDLLENEQFLRALERGEEYLPVKYRKVTLRASDYTDKYYQGQKNNGPRHFLQHAVKLWDASLIKTQDDPSSSQLVALLGKRIITDVAFVVESKGKEKRNVELTINDIKDGKAFQAKEITFVLNELVAIQSMFLQKNFTRIDNAVSGHLTPKAEKLYSTLKMESKVTPVNIDFTQQNGVDTFEKIGDLTYWNTYFNTNHKTIRRLIDSFKVHKEISEKTELNVSIEGFTRGRGKKYDALRVVYFEQAHLNYQAMPEVVQKATKPTRKLVRRPPNTPVGSAREGDWAKANIKILTNFELELKRIGRRLPAVDVERMVRYHKILGMTYAA